MLTQEERKNLANLLFPELKYTAEELEEKYPPRNLPPGAKVTRLGPSPTGFIHLGNLYGAFVDERLAHQSDGVFFLRIEDTDDKRYVEGAVKIIIDSLRFFGINFDEGAGLDPVTGEDINTGDYGDYTQSKRGEIYAAFAKKLVEEGFAYPCFLTEDEISDIRAKQEAAKGNPGIYGEYAPYREVTCEEAKALIDHGKTYVIRLKSTGIPSGGEEAPEKFKVMDAIRGELEMPVNFQDTVILKTTGIPTYHFAHVVDDHLMRTTHVVRGEEWLPSLPIHVELFEKLGWEPPIYCHTAQLMKLGEDGNKRKLSKRHDPELSLDYYRRLGYHPAAVREYLLTILNSNFEEWRIENPDADIDQFMFTTEKMSNSGALFDLDKLNDVSKDVLLKIPAKDIIAFLKAWAQEFKPEVMGIFKDEEYLEKIIDLGRNDAKPRKDLIYAEQIVDFISYFFQDMYKPEEGFPQDVPSEDIPLILEKYLATYDHSDDQSQWFDKIRDIATELGYAAKPKDFKKEPDKYKGHVGHVSTVIRVALMGRSQSPDVHTIQQIMGEALTRSRISGAMS
ncbi:MAG: glutamate--tRNA ligase [Firmicutes bacterium]|nr:glutamate--tRNA ligase [Bacillota bacterium]